MILPIYVIRETADLCNLLNNDLSNGIVPPHACI